MTEIQAKALEGARQLLDEFEASAMDGKPVRLLCAAIDQDGGLHLSTHFTVDDGMRVVDALCVENELQMHTALMMYGLLLPLRTGQVTFSMQDTNRKQL